MQRRDFLKLSAMAAATAAATQSDNAHASDGVTADQARRTGDGVAWDKAPCRFCGTGCHVQVGTKGGKVVAIAGDQQADVNRGLLCVKGYHVGLALYGKDRLTTPQKRVNGKLVDISWDEALTIIAERAELDPAGFAFYGSGQWTIPEGWAAMKFVKGGLGNNHVDPNARLCMASAVTGFIGTYGVDEPASVYDDLDTCDVVITWGNNPAEMHPVLFSRIVDRRSKGETVTFIDLGTRRTRTSAYADHYMQFHPQSDLALANGIMHLLIKNGTWDKDFVEQHCAVRKHEDGNALKGQAGTWEEFTAHLEEYTPDYVSQVSGVSVSDIHLLAKHFGNRDTRIVSLWCMGVNQHTRGTAMNELIHAVHLLSGHFGRPGDGPTSLTGQPSACGTCREVGTLAHALPGGRLVAKEPHRQAVEEAWNVPAGRIHDKPGYHTVKMWEQWSKPKADGGDVHTIWVQVTNPAQSLPNLERLVYPGAKDPDKFLIVSDVYPTATTELADLVLPSALWVEKNGVYGNSERRTQQWFKMVDPPGQARDDCWQIIAAAKKLFDRGFEGMKNKEGKFLFTLTDDSGREVDVARWENYYGKLNVDRALYEEYRPLTHMKHKHVAPYDVLAQHRGMRWPVVQDESGAWKETRWRFVEGHDPFVEAGKGFDFYHSTSGDGKAQLWIRPYDAPPEVPDDEYPFWLCTGRVLEHWHTGTMTGRIPQLQDAMPQSYVELNRQDAARLGVQNGEVVELATRRGTLELPCWIDGRGKPPPGTVFVPFFDERLRINDLTLHEHCPISKEPDYKKCAATVRKLMV